MISRTFLKYLLLTEALLACSASVSAIPANPKPIRLTQPDGSTVTVQLHGDENHHYMTRFEDGVRVRRSSDGFLLPDFTPDFDYTRLAADPRRRHASGASFLNKSAASEAVLHSDDGSTASPTSAANLAPTRESEASATLPTDSRYLVILVNFTDRKFTFSRQDFDAWLNEEGYSQYGGTGSVRDYWRDNSMGQFVPTFTVVGPYDLSQPTAYYGAADEDTGDYDVNPRAMVTEAVQLAKADHPELDFSQFDNDGDGRMDNCEIIYAGYSQASTAVDDDIWPHTWYLADESLIIDGTVIYDYTCSQELTGTRSDAEAMEGIGTFTHEFGHVLGFMDLYDTDDYDNGLGIHPGCFDLFARGSYNNNSRTPAALWAFERHQVGWISTDVASNNTATLHRLNGAEDVTLSHFLTSGQACYIDCQPDLTDSIDGHEWLIIENRQLQGWDRYLPAHGLLIYHYDYTKPMVDAYWSQNGPNNNAKHPCLYIKCADGSNQALDRYGDTFPGLTGNTSFTDETTPNALNWNGDPTGQPITGIRESADGTVSFQVCGGTSQLQMIQLHEPQHVRHDHASLSAEWIGNATPEEVGFIWRSGKDKSVTLTDATPNRFGPGVADSTSTMLVNGEFASTISKLADGSWYTVAAFARLADGSVIYSSPMLFQTDYALARAPYYDYFNADVDTDANLPRTWQFIDANGDGTTWNYDESSAAICYDFDYWNDADDWAIPRRQFRIPEHGLLTFVRAVTSASTIEQLEVYVSTGDRRIEDFVLHKEFSFADHIGEFVYEEVDLSAYAGQDVYIGFRCASEELQESLWLFMVALTQKLDTPQITRFERTSPSQLTAEWTAVDGAVGYYLWFAQRTDEKYSEMVFVPYTQWASHSDCCDVATGQLYFRGSGEATMRPYPDGIDDLRFLVMTSGPQGASYLTVEGTTDGETWTPVGPKITLDEYDEDGEEIEWQSYVQGRGYIAFRFLFDHGGRNGRIKYLTIQYNDDYVWDELAAGSLKATSYVFNERTSGQWDQGIYALTVAAGDNLFFYDESDWAYYTLSDDISHHPSAIDQLPADDYGSDTSPASPSAATLGCYDLMGRPLKTPAGNGSATSVTPLPRCVSSSPIIVRRSDGSLHKMYILK